MKVVIRAYASLRHAIVSTAKARIAAQLTCSVPGGEPLFKRTLTYFFKQVSLYLIRAVVLF